MSSPLAVTPLRRFSQILSVFRSSSWLDSNNCGLRWPWEELTRERSLYSPDIAWLKPWFYGILESGELICIEDVPAVKELGNILWIDRGVRWASRTCSACSAEEQSRDWLTLLFIHEKEPSEAEPFVLDTFNKCKTSGEKKKHKSPYKKQLNNYAPSAQTRPKTEFQSCQHFSFK